MWAGGVLLSAVQGVHVFVAVVFRSGAFLYSDFPAFAVLVDLLVGAATARVVVHAAVRRTPDVAVFPSAVVLVGNRVVEVEVELFLSGARKERAL